MSIVKKQVDKSSCVVGWCRDDTSKKLISSWKIKLYIKISTLKKQFFRTLLIKAIEFLRVFAHANLLWRKI